MGRGRILLAIMVALSVAFPLASSSSALAAAGALDPAFGTGGYSTTSIGTLAVAAAAVVQGDGKIVTAGEAQIDGKSVLVSTRVNPNGTLDSGYGTGGTTVVDIGGSSCGNALALQPDGKIVIAGTGIDSGSGSFAFTAVRLLADGQPDPSFGHAGIATVPIGSGAIANAVAIEPDGKIVLAGTAAMSHNVFALARLSSDGTVDQSFGSNGVSTLAPAGAAWGMSLQPDGKLVLAGQGSYGSGQAFMAARVLANGSPDPGFGTGGVVTIPIGATAIANGVALQPDGRIVLAGNAFTSAGVAAAARLLSDGTLDRTFGSGGVATQPLWQAINAVALERDGKILLAATGANVLRLNADGSPDRTFGSAGAATAQLGDSTDAANGVTVQSDGKIVLSGCAHVGGRTVLSVIRLLADGAASTAPGSPAATAPAGPAVRPATRPAKPRTTAPSRRPDTAIGMRRISVHRRHARRQVRHRKRARSHRTRHSR